MTKIGKAAISVNNPAFRKCSLRHSKIKQLSACFSPRVYSNESEQRTTVMTTWNISVHKCRISQCEPVPSLPLSEFSNLSQDYLRWGRGEEGEWLNNLNSRQKRGMEWNFQRTDSWMKRGCTHRATCGVGCARGRGSLGDQTAVVELVDQWQKGILNNKSLFL